MKKLTFAPIVALALAMIAPQTHAQSYSLNFQMPSNNIVCGGDLPADEANGRAAWHGVVCSMVTPIALPQAQAKQCSHGWGYEFVLPENGAAERPCHSHLPVQFDAPVLKYGAKISGKGWTCKSEYSGLTCTNADNNGFRLRKSEQTLFSGSEQQAEQPETAATSEVAEPSAETASETALP